jgi:hypothetical protein
MAALRQISGERIPRSNCLCMQVSRFGVFRLGRAPVLAADQAQGIDPIDTIGREPEVVGAGEETERVS